MLPSELYQRKLINHEWEYNPAQETLIKTLDIYYRHLKRNKLQKIILQKKHKKGLYIWGTVGSGKTSLTNCMLEACNELPILRLHFHEFMETIKTKIQAKQGQKNPVDLALKDLSKQYKLLFIDEFCIHDIGYAVLLKNILAAALRYNLFIIVTSNQKPKNSYTGIINKELFDPAIEIINNNFLVFNLDSDLDYRTLNKHHNQNYFHPLTKATADIIQETFNHLSQGEIYTDDLVINNRPVKTISYSSSSIWLDFNSLCNIPRSKADYIYLAKHYNTILVSELKTLNQNDKNLIINFCHFIDICYENKIRVIISSSCCIDDIFNRNVNLPITKRTISRLKHLQSNI